MTSASTRRWFRLLLGLAITTIFVVVIARGVDGPALVATLGRARLEWLAFAVVLFFVGYGCRIARWWTMLRVDNPALRLRDCTLPMFASVAANNILPFRMGDVLRVFGFSRQLGVPTPMMLASLVAERLFDLMCLLIALGVCVLVIDFDHSLAEQIAGLGGVGLMAAVALIAGLLLFPGVFERPANWALLLLGKALPKLAATLGAFVDKVFVALRHLSSGPRMLALFAWSGLAWIFEGLVFWATARSIPAFDPVAGVLAFPVSTLATMLPSSPGYLGTFDYFVIKSAEAVGSPPVAATAFALLVHLVIWLPATLVGGVGLALLSRRSGRNAGLFRTSLQSHG